MASKGTFSATQRATAPNVQFGQTVRQITSDIETRRKTALQEDLATQSRKAAATKEANRIRKEDNENADKFNKLASKMLGVDASGVMSNVLTESLKINQGRYAELREEYNDASPERQTEIKAETRGYNASVGNLNQLGKNWSTFFNDYNSKLGQKGGYSAYGSGKRIYDIANTLYSASKQGLKRNKDGTYNMGEFITIENLGKPNMQFRVRNNKGEQIAYNSPQNIMNELGGGLKQYQDVEGLLLDFNKVSGNFTYLKNFDPTSDVGNMTKVANVDDMKANINTLVENKFANNPDLVNEIIGRKIQRKNANGELMVDKKGNPDLLDSKEEIMQYYEDQTFLLKKRNFDNIQKHNPNYKNNKKQINISNRRADLQGYLMANETSARAIKGLRWNDQGGGKIIDWFREGNTLQVVMQQGSGENRQKIPLKYDMKNPNVVKYVTEQVNNMVATKRGEPTISNDKLGIDYSNFNIDIKEEGSFAFKTGFGRALSSFNKGLDDFSKLPVNEIKSDNVKNLLTDEIKNELSDAGYDIKYNNPAFDKGRDILITNPDEVETRIRFKFTPKGKTDFVNKLREKLRDIRIDIEGNASTTVEGNNEIPEMDLSSEKTVVTPTSSTTTFKSKPNIFKNGR